jgi:glycosyltransferase involved in cell wall biosynthesis
MTRIAPEISIILPLYNNTTRFLPSGIECIKNQTFKNWELVAINDGSTDSTEELLFSLVSSFRDKVVYKAQENGGGFAARNTGLDLASGKYLAFFDCDDSWLPYHLEEPYNTLEKHQEIDWVFATNRIVNVNSGEILSENIFYFQDGKKKPLLNLKAKKLGELNILDDPEAARCQILDGLSCGQQFPLIRKKGFEGYRFRASYRNEGADQISVIRSLKKGVNFAYIDKIHEDYAVHDNNASAGCLNAPIEKYLRLRTAMIRGFEELKKEEPITKKESRAIDQRIARELFWDIGYNLYWQNNDRASALKFFISGIRRYTYETKFWKTFFISYLKTLLHLK